MKTYTESSSAIILHSLISGIVLIHDGQPVEWINVPTEKREALELAIRESILINNGVHDWYEMHWELFPFGEPTYSNLTDLKQELVETAASAVYSLRLFHGSRMRDVNE